MMTAHKLALHLFVAMRSQLARITQQSVWLHIVFALSFSDPCLILAACRQHGVCLQQVSMTIYIWMAINDFVIGIFCSVIFALPLLKLMKVEKAAIGAAGKSTLIKQIKQIYKKLQSTKISNMTSVILDTQRCRIWWCYRRWSPLNC